MGTRFRHMTETTIGGSTIQLKHKGLWLGQGEVDYFKRIVINARSALGVTIGKIFTGSADLLLAQRYFMAPGGLLSNAEWQKVQAKLELILGGLSADVTLKLGADGDRGFIRRKVVPQGTVGAQRYRDGTYVRWDVHEIHLSKRLLLNDADEDNSVRTLIHEAGHKYANLYDYDRPGYRNAADDGWLADGLNKGMALNNSDSYAYFAIRQWRIP